MKFSELWLRKYVNPSVSTEELIQRLTMSGLEVESEERVSQEQFPEMYDHIIDINITPNRGDCLSVVGMAREVAALYDTELTLPPVTTVPNSSAATFPVAVLAPEDCAYYVGRIIKGINSKALTPSWMQEMLRHCGLNTVHPVVDIANYVMLECGQPLHAFDLNTLSGGLQIRRAHADEPITTLEGRQLLLSEDTLIIADHQKAQAIAGIMGGLDSAVTAHTVDLFLESAYFNPLTIAGRARRYGLSTDASHRFERGVDPSLQRKACERATQLLIEITGCQAGPIIESRSEVHIPKNPPIKLRRERIKRLLGIEISDQTVEGILKRLNMEIKIPADTANVTWEVIAPAYRFDIALEVDLIEEIGRIFGYDNIEPRSLPTIVSFTSLPEKKLDHTRFQHLLVDRGYQEAITYSFIEPELQQLIDPNAAYLRLANPISSELSVMRTSLWPGLLSAAQYNVSRQQDRVQLFETGLCYRMIDQQLIQRPSIAGLLCGTVFPEQWGIPSRPLDFFDIKSTVEGLIALTGCEAQYQFVRGEHSALHPGQSSEIKIGDKSVGWLGALHPAIAKALELKHCFLFEMDLIILEAGILPQFSSLSKFPRIRRDIAFTVKETVTAAQLQLAIREAGGEWLNNVHIFDVYQGKGIPDGQKSIAIGLDWQHPSRTLVESEINSAMERVIGTLQQKFAVILRL